MSTVRPGWPSVAECGKCDVTGRESAHLPGPGPAMNQRASLRTRFKMRKLEGRPCSRPSFGLLSYGTFTVNAIWSESPTGLSVNVFTSSWLALQNGLFGWYRTVTMPTVFE